MPSKIRKCRAGVKDRPPLTPCVRKVYHALFDFIDRTPDGCSLPSIKELQKKYRAGQQTVMQAVRILVDKGLVVSNPRKGLKVIKKLADSGVWPPQDTGQNRWVEIRGQAEAVLALPAPLWQLWRTIAAEFNRTRSSGKIKLIRYEDHNAYPSLSAELPFDLILFDNHPLMFRKSFNPLQFIDCRVLMAKSLTLEHFHPVFTVSDRAGRVWGVAPTLTPFMICRNRAIVRAAGQTELPRQWNWIQLARYVRRLKQKSGALEFGYYFNGYLSFLFHWGAALIDERSGQIKLAAAALGAPLNFIRQLISEGIAPAYSSVRNSHLDLFLSGKCALIECFSHDIKQLGKAGFTEYDVLPVPLSSGVKRPIYSEMFCINAASRFYEQCWDFISFALTPNVQQFLADHQTNLPVRIGVRSDHWSWTSPVAQSEFLGDCARPIEDYYLPAHARRILEAGIDRWIKFGGNLQETLLEWEQLVREGSGSHQVT